MPRVKVFTDGDPAKDGCAYYRTYLPGSTLANEGADVVVERGTRGVVWADDVLVSGKRDPRVRGWQDPDCDVAVFQRPLHRDVADLIEWCAAAPGRPRTVVDLDDDLYRIPRDNAAYPYAQPSLSPLRNTDHLRRAIESCDLVTVTTPALAKRFARHKSVVLPNYVPESVLHLPPRPLPDGPVVLGWTGTRATHPHDLESTKGGVAAALTQEGGVLHVVGDGIGVQEALGVPDTVPFTKTGWVPLSLYPLRMSEIDVGIVPLHSCSFNHGKSWLKGLEFASVGVPFVASNTESYVRLQADHQLGLVARSPQSWTHHVARLLRDARYREHEGEVARHTVAAHLTIEQHVQRWWDAWTSTLANTGSLDGGVVTTYAEV